MGLVTRQHESGLVLAETLTDEAGLRRALKQIDDRLTLVSPGQWIAGDQAQSMYWRVMRLNGGDQPPAPVLIWMDEAQNPLPLTWGLIDEVNRHRLGGRGYGPTADERNAQLVADVRKAREDNVQAIHDEYEPYLERGRVGVSLGARNRLPYWQRKSNGGYL